MLGIGKKIVICLFRNYFTLNSPVPRKHVSQIILNLISGFHRALLQSITFISRLNALDYTKT